MKSVIIAALAGVALAESAWTTTDNKLRYNGEEVILHGFATNCTQNMFRNLTQECWHTYNPHDAHNVISQMNPKHFNAMLSYFDDISAPGVKPAVRVPLTASYWLGIETENSKANMDRYKDLNLQYQNLISEMVGSFTAHNAVVILDLHWSDDDVESQNYAAKATATDFWKSVAQKFHTNDHVFFEVYNEANVTGDVFIHGSDEYASMFDMVMAIHDVSFDPVIVVGGPNDYSYDAATLCWLNSHLDMGNFIYNFHPFMSENHNDTKKTPQDYEAKIKQIQECSDFPVISTGLGQYCCSTHGECGTYTGVFDDQHMGYDEAILQINNKYNVSWTASQWTPGAQVYEAGQCQNINANGDIHLVHPTDNVGADWQTLWDFYADKLIESEEFTQ